MNDTFNGTFRNGTGVAAAASGPVSAHTLRLALTVTHLSLVCIGTVNLLVIVLILLRPRYMRSITNVYMIGLCLADFIYLTNLTLVAATQLSDKSWPFGSMICTLYHGTETTGKYASVLFVVLLASDRYCAMCRANWCARYRNYQTAIFLSICAWIVAFLFALPLYTYASQVYVRFKESGATVIYCIANWPSSDSARWYISISSICLFAAPMVFIIYFYYHILIKLREAVKGSKRLQRASSTRAPYQRVTRLVLWVVIFHVICWSPFWLFNLFSSIFKTRITTHFERIVVNILHLFPYVNCALNPLLYAAHAENFRLACRSLFGCAVPDDVAARNEKSKYISNNNRDVVHKDSKYVTAAVILPVDGDSTVANYTIIKTTENNNRNFLTQPDVPSNRSLSDSNTLQNKHAKIEAQNSIANSRGYSSFSCHSRFGEQYHPLPQPSGWRKYSELEPPNGESKQISSRTPLLSSSSLHLTHSLGGQSERESAWNGESGVPPIVLLRSSFDDENDVHL